MVAAAANNARSMINCSTSSGLYKRLEKCERLRASSLPGSGSGKKTSKQGNKKRELEVKAFEFVLVDAEDEEDDFSMTTVISDETVLLRGFVQIRSDATENDIRREISEAIQIKYPLVTATDIEFLKANRKKLMKPVNSSEYNFKQIKLLAGQGAIYVKVKNGYDCLLKSNEEEGRDKKKQKVDESEDDSDSFSISSVFAPQGVGETSAANEPSASTVASPSFTSISASQVPPVVSDARGDGFSTVIADVISFCQDNNIENPVEILRVAQKTIVTGRPLEQSSTFEDSNTETNFILIDRANVFGSAKDELELVTETTLRLTLEVSFYGEIAKDSGGPRKEFFRLALREVKQKHFDDGFKVHLEEDYVMIGVLMALSILQNGPVPRFISENILQELFSVLAPSNPCVLRLREGLDKLGLVRIGTSLPTFLYLLRPSPATLLTRRALVSLLTPRFSEEGSNAMQYQQATYTSFMNYVRAAAAGQRLEGHISLEDILEFTTCSSEEPVLGFEPHPEIQFREADSSVKWSFLPTSQTCANILFLPVASYQVQKPSDVDLFEVYDHAFGSKYFGKG